MAAADRRAAMGATGLLITRATRQMAEAAAMPVKPAIRAAGETAVRRATAAMVDRAAKVEMGLAAGSPPRAASSLSWV